MKQKHTPFEKQSKRKQREQHAARRGTWGALNPITRKAQNPKAYKRNENIVRKKSGRWLDDDEPQSGLLFCV